MNDRVSVCRCLAGALISLAVASSALAQVASVYPNRPIRLVVPYAPGGSSDFTARVLQPALGEELGQQIVIDNRSGAAGNIGVEVAARANSDGYTLLLGNVGTIAISPGLYPSFPIRPLRDLLAIIEVADLPSLLVVHPSLGVTSVQDFIAHAKKRPGQFNFAGTGSSNRIDTESFVRAAGIKTEYVPYKGGAGPAVIGLLANETQAMFALLSAASGFVKQGRLKAIGVTASKRIALLPDVPTLPEAGFAAMKSGSWQGLFAPRHTPSNVVHVLFSAVTKAMEHPDVRKRLADAGIAVTISKSPAEFTEFIKSETTRFALVIKEAGITAD
jgi:tripartite-type tricarboxylate transporter receptor subunit TctC